MEHSYLQIRSVVFLLIASISFGEVSAQSDSLRSARTESTQSVNGTVTYDGTGAGTGGVEATYNGYNSGQVSTGNGNSFFGAYSGNRNTAGQQGVFLGYRAGYSNTTGNYNTFVGQSSGEKNITGYLNVFVGGSTGFFNTTGKTNSFLGYAAGFYNTTGEANTLIGANAGFNVTTGSRNTFIGQTAGNNNQVGIGNVFLGYKAGYKEVGNNKLYIASSDTINPLIYGDFAAKYLVLNGKVGVSTSTFPTSVNGADVSAYKLFVKGGILSDEVRVRTGWADYVFKNDYKLKSLLEVEEFINKNGHLPNVPAARQIENQGLEIGNISRIQQEKIEELTLYAILQNKQITNQQKEINELKVLVMSLLQK